MRVLFALSLGLTACAGNANEAGAPEGYEALNSGRECALASGACEHGRCTVAVDNRCETPVTCQMRIESQCRTASGDIGPATASTRKLTQLKGARSTLEARTNCEGEALVTRVEALECI